MAKTRRNYAGGAISTTTSGVIASSGTTTFSISGITGWPYGSAPFFVVVEPGTANEEKMLVVRAGSSDTTVSIYSTPSVDANRGLDGTVAVAHSSGSVIYPVFTATDADEANEVASTLTTKGDLLTHGSTTFARVAVGTNNHVLIADSSQSAGIKWGQIGSDGIASSAVTAEKIAGSAVETAKIADLNVTTGKIADGAITTVKIGDDQVTAAKLAADAVTEVLVIPISDEITAITSGTAKVTFRMPFAMTLTGVRASLTAASSSGTPTFDINENGSSILSTKLTIDQSEKTSTTAATPAVISDSSLADDAEMTIDVDVAGTGAKGAKIYLIGYRT